MDWIQITSALFMVAMLVYIFPRMRQAIKESPEGTSKDWIGFLLIIIAVIAFVLFLISIV